MKDKLEKTGSNLQDVLSDPWLHTALLVGALLDYVQRCGSANRGGRQPAGPEGASAGSLALCARGWGGEHERCHLAPPARNERGLEEVVLDV